MSAIKNYIPHIDGMRAISVLAVIFFHFHLLGFTGGYIGVDVFFTISGYLIIGSIVGQAEAGKFKASSFWGRRVRRLFPAIFAILFLSFIAGLLLMSPSDLIKLSRDSIFGLVSLINFTLLGSTDYFDLQGFNEPLLHFWSLAVEEQFYLVFPLIAMGTLAVFRDRTNYKKTIIWILIILSILSLIWAEYVLRFGNPLFAYYMMPTRFFQLALGGVLAIALQSDAFRQNRETLPKIIHDILVFAAIAAIIALSLIFTKTTPFPGINAIWPTLAALALLYSGGHSRLRLSLENPVSAHIGKLSYSLYLVHWPVWSFMCYYFDRVLTLPETLVALALTYLISLFIYKCIEKPVRFSPVFSGRRLYIFVAPAIATTACLLFTTQALQGLPQRIPADKRAFAKDAGEFHRLYFGGRGYASSEPLFIGHTKVKPELVLIGDSKAQQFGSGLDLTLDAHSRSAVMVTMNGCRFIPGAERITEGALQSECQTATERALATIREHKVDVISIRSWKFSANPSYRLYNTTTKEALSQRDVIKANLDFHREILNLIGSDNTLTIVSDMNVAPENSTVIAHCLSRPTFLGLRCLENAAANASDMSLSSVEVALRDFAAEHRNVEYFMPDAIYCDKGVCRQIADDGTILFSDSSHLSKAGSARFAPRLLGLEPLPDSTMASIMRSRQKASEELDETSEEYLLSRAWVEGDAENLDTLIAAYVDTVFDRRRHNRFIKNLWEGRDGFSQNRELGLLLAEKLSEKFDSREATYISGVAYWVGAATEKDLGKTLTYWNKPSQNANATVQYRMAQIYLKEDLPHYDYQLGLEKLQLAAAAGHADAIKHLATLNK